MKELEKTQRISIAAIITILILTIALLSFKKPKFSYHFDTNKALERVVNEDYFILLEDIKNSDYVLIDVRNQYEFEKGHIENAINIYTPEILSDNNITVFKNLKETGKTAILYGNSPNDVIVPYMLLYQLGYNNLKILTIKNRNFQNKLISENIEIEKYENDIAGFISESVKKASVIPKAVPKPQPKKVITIEKKKKAPAEGGC